MSVPGTEGNQGNPNADAAAAAAAAAKAAGTGDGTGGDGGAGGEGDDGKVSVAEFKRVQADMFKAKQAAKDAQTAVERLKAQGLKEKEDYKALYEQEAAARAEADKKLNGLNSAIVSDRKMSALQREAAKAGLIDGSMDLLEKFDFPEVDIETDETTGRVKVTGADRAIARLKASKPFLFGKSAPTINSNTPGVTTGERITYEKLEEMRIQASKSLGRNSAEWKAYEAAMDQFKKQA